MTLKEKDWKLFRKLLPQWQERCLEKLTEEYKELLNGDMSASEKFWTLDNRICEDKKCTGVLAKGVNRSQMNIILMNLLNEGAITKDDLQDFSEELCDSIDRWFESELW